MEPEACPSGASGRRDALGNDEVDGDLDQLAIDLGGPSPHAGLLGSRRSHRVTEPSAHDLLEERNVGEAIAVDCQITIGRVLRDADVRCTGSEIHGLRADDDDGITVLDEIFERVEQHSTCGHVIGVGLHRPRSR